MLKALLLEVLSLGPLGTVLPWRGHVEGLPKVGFHSLCRKQEQELRGKPVASHLDRLCTNQVQLRLVED